MTTFEFFSKQFQHQLSQLIAIYVKTSQGCYDLNFFYYDNKEKWIITNRRLQDEDFFRQLYQQYAVSRNDFLTQFDNIAPVGKHKKQCLIDVPNSSIKRSIEYVVIQDIKEYLNSGLFNG